MGGFILGIDLENDYCRISGLSLYDFEPRDLSFTQADGRTLIQTAIGKKKGVNEWMIGREAYEAALTGEGFVADNLLSRLIRGEVYHGTDADYSAQELMTHFFESLIQCACLQFQEKEPEDLVITVRRVDTGLVDSLTACLDEIGLGREHIHITSHTEAFLYYVLSQKKEYWTNETVLFDMTGKNLHYYSMSVTRGVRPHVIHVAHETMDTEISADQLGDEKAQRMLDSRLADYAGRLLNNRSVSAVLITGRGLEECQQWSRRTFLMTLCSKRKVYQEQSIYAKGAVVIGADRRREKTAFPYTVICEGRLRCTIMMEVMSQGQKKNLILAGSGSCWYDVRSSIELILDDTDAINVKVISPDDRTVRTFSIPLDHFPKRPPRTTRVQVILNLVSETEAIVRVIDLGFGELFPASRIVKKSRILLEEPQRQ